MKRIMYDPHIKWKAIELKKKGIKTNDIMSMLNIKNKTQVETWWKWYRDGQTHRFEQPLGKQYTFGKGPVELNELDTANQKIKYLKMELDILKKILGALKK
ncbi:hypothetical protein LJB88_04060 [Erysipelotrichaceae bacterium OttesenSCG-928-M19]|nr:hypothetical protein [Erysipelotrichaceae bacterium OttesenSCG-928-M19]